MTCLMMGKWRVRAYIHGFIMSGVIDHHETGGNSARSDRLIACDCTWISIVPEAGDNIDIR
jgi:hypothetical protein